MADTKWKLLAQRIVGQYAKRKYSLEELQKEFVAFVDYYVENPSSYVVRSKKKQKGANKNVAEFEFMGDRVERTAPMTEYAFCLWLGMSKSWFPQTIADLKAVENPNDYDLAYLDFMLRVQTFLHSQMIEGAVLGEYNGQLVSNLLGIRSNFDVTSDGKATAAPVISIIEDTKSRDDYDAKNQ